jgi:hypothetical protein
VRRCEENGDAEGLAKWREKLERKGEGGAKEPANAVRPKRKREEFASAEPTRSCAVAEASGEANEIGEADGPTRKEKLKRRIERAKENGDFEKAGELKAKLKARRCM